MTAALFVIAGPALALVLYIAWEVRQLKRLERELRIERRFASIRERGADE